MMRTWMLALVLGFSFLGLETSQAGVFEISATGSYRKTNFDANHTAAMESVTGGLAYYFWELSALQLSYTRGAANQVQPEYTAYQTFEAYGLDLLITIASRESALKPYIKAGAAYVVKDLRTYVPVPGSNPILYNTLVIQTFGVSPTAGLGFKLMLGQQFAIKAGVDVSTSPLRKDSNEPTTYDFAANGGISFLF